MGGREVFDGDIEGSGLDGRVYGRKRKGNERSSTRGALYVVLMVLMVSMLAVLELRRQNEVLVRLQKKTSTLAEEFMSSGSKEHLGEGAEDGSANVTAREGNEKGETQPVVSLQELKDDVDEFIQHVEKEEAFTVKEVEEIKARRKKRKEFSDPPDGASSSTLTFSKASLDEAFSDARKLLKALRPVVGLENHIEVDALMLQSLRGDFDEESVPSLFKTEEDISSDEIEVEQGDIIWEKWKGLKGMYRSEAMRRFAAMVEDLEAKLEDQGYSLT